MELLIFEKSGWSMPVKIERATTRIGSAASNDVRLQSAQIAAVHLQVFYSPDLPSSCKVVNMANDIQVKIGQDTRQLSKYGRLDIYDGNEIMLGDYRIKFNLPINSRVVQSAKLIEASLIFAEAVLRPEYETVGQLTVKNAGERPKCQFQVDIDGLPEDCYQIDPIPLMYPGAREEVRVRIFHRQLYPPAGLQKIIFKISAPESYPGENFVIEQGLYVWPVFDQSFDLIDDVAAAKAAEMARVPAAPPAVSPAGRMADLQQPEPSVPAFEPPAPVMPAPVSRVAEPARLAVAPVTLVASKPVQQPASSLDEKPEPEAAPVPAPVMVSAVPTAMPEKVSQADDQVGQNIPVRPVKKTPPVSPVQNKPPESDQNTQKSPSPSQQEQNLSKLKVVRGPADEFWNEQ
jgi:hypothetical protein